VFTLRDYIAPKMQPQNRHLRASAWTVSAQLGHFFVGENRLALADGGKLPRCAETPTDSASLKDYSAPQPAAGISVSRRKPQ
jgi:hypothetical protein